MGNGPKKEAPKRFGILKGALIGALLVGGIGFLTAVVYLGVIADCWS
jgi:hypothetical protein